MPESGYLAASPNLPEAQTLQMLQELRSIEQMAQSGTQTASNPSTSSFPTTDLLKLALAIRLGGKSPQTDLNLQTLPFATPNASNSSASTDLSNSEDVLSKARDFRIAYKRADGTTNVFVFGLLPAMESNLRNNGIGATVPEVKPGILVRTSMNIKRFNVPGGPPVFQTLGVEQTILQLVGLFVGSEGVSIPAAPLNPVLYGGSPVFAAAQRQSQLFDTEVVQSGCEVDLYIRAMGNSPDATVQLTYRALIQNFRCFMARSDRVYYSMEAVLTKYQQARLAFTKPTAAPTPAPTPVTPPASTTTAPTASQPKTLPKTSSQPKTSPQSNPTPAPKAQ